MRMTIENITENQAVAVLSLLDPKHKGILVEEKFTPTNKTNGAIAAIEGALRIKDLWLPDDSYKGEHEQEAYALQNMYRAFLEVTQQQHH